MQKVLKQNRTKLAAATKKKGNELNEDKKAKAKTMEVAAATFNYGYSNYGAGTTTDVAVGVADSMVLQTVWHCGWRDAVMADGGWPGGGR